MPQDLTTYGNNDVKVRHKHADPTLCSYTWAYRRCTLRNEIQREKIPRGNGTQCRLVLVKLKLTKPNKIIRKYYGTKLWTINATDAEWIECEHILKTNTIIGLKQELHRLTTKCIVATSK